MTDRSAVRPDEVGPAAADNDLKVAGLTADGYFVKCRRPGCGPHPIRERAVPCRYCRTDCWDHHAVCASCHACEEAELHLEESASP